MLLYTSRKHNHSVFGLIGVNIPPNTERSTCVLRSQAIPRGLFKVVLLANLNSYMLSKIGERGRDCRLDRALGRPNLGASWLLRYVNGVQIVANRKEIQSAVRRRDIGGSLGSHRGEVEWGCGIGNDKDLPGFRITVKSYQESVFSKS
jgi:hypothetical protein